MCDGGDIKCDGGDIKCDGGDIEGDNDGDVKIMGQLL